MPKPNLLLLAFSSVFLSAAGLLAADTVAPLNAPATPDAAAGAKPLELTPEAINKTEPLVDINLARWFFGAHLLLPGAGGKPTILTFDKRSDTPFGIMLDDDATEEYALAAGDTAIAVDLGSAKQVQRFGFFSFDAAGSVDLYYSDTPDAITSLDPANKQWTSLNAHTDFQPRQPVSVDLKAADLQYVLIVYHTKTPGGVGTVSLFGQVSLKSTLANAPDQNTKSGPPPNLDDLIEFDYANRAFGSKVTHVAGGDVKQAQGVLTSDPTKKLDLGGNQTTGPAAPGGTKLTNYDNIFIVDMGKRRDINKVGLLFATQGPGKFEFYFLDSLPAQGAPKTALLERARAAQPVLLASNDAAFVERLFLAQAAGDASVSNVQYLPDNFFNTNKPAITQDITSDSTKIAQTFSNNLSFRYALVRWIPQSNNQPPVVVMRVNLIGKVPPDNYYAASKIDTVSLGLPNSVNSPNPPALNNPTSGGNPITGGSGGGTGGGGGNPPEPPPTPPAPVSP